MLHPAAPETAGNSLSQPIPSIIMAAAWVNQIAKKRRKMLEIGHFNSFSNISCSKQP
ncbi:hypothetical protein [Paraburkholderia bryophila]|uniref:Uncharacterized protein n=2 Tax=Paraburkholderia bryophila TaxID=420952 RepID=A0A7Z0B332_9BURK|nr:hypothetical protein [Paraburkholderia bryophila]NYH18155.1 hypothetical protein [Paraburkholderia bryophila]